MTCSVIVILTTLCVVIVNLIALKVVIRRIRSIRPPTYEEICRVVPGFREEFSEEEYKSYREGKR